MTEVGEVVEVMVFDRQQRKGEQWHQDVTQNYTDLMRDLHSYRVQSIRRLGAEADRLFVEGQAGDNGLEVAVYMMVVGCTVLVAQVPDGHSLAVAEEVVSSLMEGAVVQCKWAGFEGEGPCHCYLCRNH